MTEADRELLRAQLALPIVTVQNRLRERGIPVEDVIPEVIAALLSLAAHVARENADMTAKQFIDACGATAILEWL